MRPAMKKHLPILIIACLTAFLIVRSRRKSSNKWRSAY
jgi:hypothetical protein